MKKLLTYTLTITLLVFSEVSWAQMTAGKVTKKVREAYKEQIKGIDDLTKRTNRGITFQKWIRGSGETIHKFRKEEDINGKTQITVYDGTYYRTKNPYTNEVTKKEIEGNPEVFYKYLESFDFEYAGRDKVNGIDCHVLIVESVPLSEIKDPTTGDSMIPPDAEGMQDATVDAKLFIDSRRWVMVKSVFDAQGLQMQGRRRGARTVIVNKDFRNIEGLVIAYHTRMNMTIDMTEEEKQKMKEARQSMRQMKERMKNMSPAKRKMLEKYMKPEMQKAQSMMMNGGMSKEIKVQNVKINQGISDDLFDGSSL
ncbi:MAG TPA: hypothetical protein VKO43_06850 [Candidatus Krumholzibacteriaceae bacterium]|nr:hypothetical protein [Candidatus Krumholzibacteriaceae bacterium]